MKPSEHRLAFVTGTSSGIGAAVARRLLDAGWTVIGFSRRNPSDTHERYRHVALDLGDLQALKTVAGPAIAPVIGECRWSRAPQPHNRMFVEFHAQGLLAPPDAPAAEIVEFLGGDHLEPFAERRFGAT
jgi:NAD(P)-dependent dehydrogenase (short-subunit alcohol dehydrogenase family)